MSAAANAPTPLIDLRQVSKRFGERKIGAAGRALQSLGLSKPPAITRAVDHVDLIVNPGEVVGLVGESGCGKSTLGRIAAGLLTPSGGEVRINGVRPADMNSAQAHAARLKVQMIFQDPYASLNPRLRVDEIVGEAARIHGLVGNGDFDDYVSAQLERAGLDPALRQRYPHQFSGGQRQRIGIARALAVQPSMLVCDEAVAALDVSIQAQILNLLMDLQKDRGLSYLFITHDMAVVEKVSHRVAVLYLGQIVELGTRRQIFESPQHAYTRKLLAAVPVAEPGRHIDTSLIEGEIPSPVRRVGDEPAIIPLIEFAPGHQVARAA